MKETNEPSLSKPDFNEAAKKYVKTLSAINYKSSFDFGIQNMEAFKAGCNSVLNDYVTPLQKELYELKEKNERLKAKALFIAKERDKYCEDVIYVNKEREKLESELIRAKDLLKESRDSFVMLSLIDRSNMTNEMLTKLESFLKEVK